MEKQSESEIKFGFPEGTEVMYRYWDCPGETSPPYVAEYAVIKHTDQGCWIDRDGRKKFILKNSRKRWAYETEFAAMVAYVKRKYRAIELTERSLEKQKLMLAKTQEWTDVQEHLAAERRENFRLEHLFLTRHLR